MHLFTIFLTGLTTGGLSCLAMQGGLLAGVIANQKKSKAQATVQEVSKTGKHAHTSKSIQLVETAAGGVLNSDWLPVFAFLIAKLISHTVLGLLLGSLGSVLTLSLSARLFFQALTAVYLFATAMNLLKVHPIFRYIALQPPRFLQRMVKSTSRASSVFAPAVLGFFTILVPCGITQAMEVTAISSGSATSGALILFLFVLGTSPLFALLGILTTKLTEAWTQRLTKASAYLLIAMAIYGFNGVLLVLNSPFTLQTVFSPISYFFSQERFGRYSAQTLLVDGVQKVTIGVFNSGYSPKYAQVTKGIPVELTITSKDTYSCALAFRFEEFGISTFLESTDTQKFTFTPQKKGRFRYTCSMGMYSGVIEVL